MAAYTYQQRSTWSRGKIVAVSIVALLHIGLFVAINSGLKISDIPKLNIPMVTRIIDDAPKQEEPIPPKLDVKTPEAEAPPIEVPDVAVDEAPPPEAPVATTTQSTVPDTSTAIAAKTDPKSPLTQPPYPPNSRRAGEEGTVALFLYVLPNGRVGEARVNKSSGFPALDESAMREAKRAWKFIPVQQNGQATAGWVTIAVTFRLTQ